MRTSEVDRRTKETGVSLELNLDGEGKGEVQTSIPFFDHMLSHLAKHSLFDLSLRATGDIEVDYHHTVEDVGIALGQALVQALGTKEGIRRYASQLVPMDEALVLVALDVSGRGLLRFQDSFPSEATGDFDTALVKEFLRAVAVNAGMTLHVQVLSGDNSHHISEAIFKALGQALRGATELDPRRRGIPSTKGTL
jgi:imidazoleglycerol-phosphate dehydratase